MVSLLVVCFADHPDCPDPGPERKHANYTRPNLPTEQR